MKRSGKWLLCGFAVLLLTALLSGTALAQDFYGRGNVLIAVDMAQYAENEGVYYPEGTMGTLVWGEGAPTGESTRAAFSPRAWAAPESVSLPQAPDYEIETVYELGQTLLFPWVRNDDPDYVGWEWLRPEALPAEAFTEDGQPRFLLCSDNVRTEDGVTEYYLPYARIGDKALCCADFLELECAAVTERCTIWQFTGNVLSVRSGFERDDYLEAVELSDAEKALFTESFDAAWESEARVYGDPRWEDRLGDRDGKVAYVVIGTNNIASTNGFYNGDFTTVYAFDCLFINSYAIPGREVSDEYATSADYLTGLLNHELNHYILSGCIGHDVWNMWLGEAIAQAAANVVAPENDAFLLDSQEVISYYLSGLQRLPGPLYAGYANYPRYKESCYFFGSRLLFYIERMMTGTESGAFWTPYFAALTQTKDFSDEALDAWLRETTGEGLEAWLAQCMAAVIVGAEDGPYCMGDAEVTALYRVDPWLFFRDAEDYGRNLGLVDENTVRVQEILKKFVGNYGLSALQGGGTAYAFRNDEGGPIAITGADDRWYFFAVDMELPDLETPIEISDAEELAKIGNDPAYPLGGHYILTNDIDLGGSEEQLWDPIGTPKVPFLGEFDGNGHTVSGLYVCGAGSEHALFATASGATFRNLTVRGSVSGTNVCAGVVGVAHYCTIESCISYVSVHGVYNTGGIAGQCHFCTVKNCSSHGSVSSEQGDCGGIAFEAGDTLLIGCVNESAVTGYQSCGGIVGYFHDNSVLDRCVNLGAVRGVRTVGGLTSVVRAGCVVRDCRSTGAVSGDEYAGALVDLIREEGTLEYCSGDWHGLPLVNENRGTLRFFRDVPDGAWYAEAVNHAANLSLVSGVGDYRFKPDGTLTRAQAAQLLYNLDGAEAPGAVADAFSDVQPGDWFAEAAAWLAESGVCGGQGASFDPNTPITRSELALWLCRYAEKLGCDVSARAALSAFSDAAALTGEAREAMEWAVAVGLIDGVAADRLSPGGYATRAQAAALLTRFGAICLA